MPSLQILAAKTLCHCCGGGAVTAPSLCQDCATALRCLAPVEVPSTWLDGAVCPGSMPRCALCSTLSLQPIQCLGCSATYCLQPYLALPCLREHNPVRCLELAQEAEDASSAEPGLARRRRQRRIADWSSSPCNCCHCGQRPPLLPDEVQAPERSCYVCGSHICPRCRQHCCQESCLTGHICPPPADRIANPQESASSSAGPCTPAEGPPHAFGSSRGRNASRRHHGAGLLQCFQCGEYPNRFGNCRDCRQFFCRRSCLGGHPCSHGRLPPDE